MKNSVVLVTLLLGGLVANGQQNQLSAKQKKDVVKLIDQYSQARENSDTILLKKILTGDIDQLVSTGEWRRGMEAAVQGMQQSSANAPGTRSLTVDQIRMITPACAIVDCRYEIAARNGETRKMWSSFMVVAENNAWKITAIRNMLPAGQ